MQLRVRASGENLADLALNRGELRVEQRLAGIKDDQPSGRQFVQMEPDGFPHPPFHAIPDDCLTGSA
jgi:hypothetical protein